MKTMKRYGLAALTVCFAMGLFGRPAARAEECDCDKCTITPTPVPNTDLSTDCCECEAKHKIEFPMDCCEGCSVAFDYTPELICEPDAPSNTVKYNWWTTCNGSNKTGTITNNYSRLCTLGPDGGAGGGGGGDCPTCANTKAPGIDLPQRSYRGESPSDRFLLGKSSNGEEAGLVRLMIEDDGNGSATAGGIYPELYTGDADPVYDPDNTQSLRQVMSAECLCTIETNSYSGYEIHFYHPEEVAGELDTNGFYQPLAAPFASYSVRQDGTALRVSGGFGNTLHTNTFALAASSNGWTLLWSGLALESTVTNSAAGALTVTRSLSAPGGATVRTVVDTREEVAGESRLTSRVEDPEGAAQVTRWYYATNGRLDCVVYPDGNWTRYLRNDLGLSVTEWSALGDRPTHTAENICRPVSHSFASVDANDTGESEFSNRPRTVTEFKAGVAVARSFYAYYHTAGGERVAIEERAAAPDSAYGASGNQRTKRTWTEMENDDPSTERIRLVEYPDGRQESSSYEVGVYTPGEDGEPGAFSENPTGNYRRTTLTQGTTDDPDGISGRTTRTVTIGTLTGHIVQEETWIYTGSANYERIAWVAYELDSFGRAVASHRSDGAVTETTWGCCGPDSVTGPDGSITDHAYDGLNRRVLTTLEGIPGTSEDRHTATVYDAAGRVVSNTVYAGSLSLTTRTAYDLAGRMTSQWDAAGLQTTIAYSEDGRSETRTLPSGATISTARYMDGRMKSETGSGATARYYEYGVTDGSNWTKVSIGSTNSVMWETSWQDALGRTVLVQKPGAAGVEETLNHFDSVGRLVKVSRTGLPDLLYSYNELGEQVRQAEDINGNGEIDLAGPDRVTGSDSYYANYSGGTVAGRSVAAGWFRVSESLAWPADGSALCVTSSVSRQRLTGFPSGVTGESVTEQTDGMAAVNWTVTDRDNRQVTSYAQSSASTGTAMQVTLNGLAVESRSAQGVRNLMFHDALGRQTAIRDGRDQDRLTVYDSAGRVDYTEDEAANQTVFGYDSAGRRTSVTDPLTNTVYTAFDAKGRTLGQWGATYPVFYDFDDSDRMTAMYTIRTNLSITSLASFSNNISLFDKTEWRYDPATGLMTNKAYADGTVVQYAYTANGKLTARTWARTVGGAALTTSYSYTNGLLIGVDYSDDTPDIVYSLDRQGRQIQAVVSGVSTSWFAYNAQGRMVAETNIQSGVLSVKTYVFDGLGRPAGFDVGSAYSVRYGFDPAGRFLSVTATVEGVSRVFTYDWDAASGLLEGWSSGDFGVTRSYEAQRPVLAYVENKFGTNVVSRYDYTVDAGGRRTVAALSGSGFGDMGETSFGYGYNSKGELIQAERVFGANPATGDPVAEQDYEFGYDPIGNRIRSTLGKADREMTYTANNVNQYTARTVPDEFAVFGTAAEDVTVSVNGDLAARQSAYYSAVLGVTNAASAAYPQVVVEAVDTNENLSAATGRVFVAQTPEGFTYDADGNLTQNGRFAYTWNAENRLIQAETRTNLPAEVPRVRLAMQYDHQGRRIERTIDTFDGTNWNWQETGRFVYDGWNLIGEAIVTGSGTVTNWYVWGLDLSGTIQGAGGVGGLLWSSIGGPSSREAVCYTFDGNGNVSELVSTSGTVRAHYEYDPFGNPTTEEGELAEVNPFRFSSKYWDSDTKTLAYQLRDYGPGIGRWLSRDPIGERGGFNLFSYCNNASVSMIDSDGCVAWVPVCCVACAGFAIWDIYQAISETCAGKTGGELAECILEKLLSLSGFGDLTSCIVSAISTAKSSEELQSKIADCFKSSGLCALRDMGKALSCGCCFIGLLQGGALKPQPQPQPEPQPVPAYP